MSVHGNKLYYLIILVTLILCMYWYFGFIQLFVYFIPIVHIYFESEIVVVVQYKYRVFLLFSRIFFTLKLYSNNFYLEPARKFKKKQMYQFHGNWCRTDLWHNFSNRINFSSWFFYNWVDFCCLNFWSKDIWFQSGNHCVGD